MARKPKLKVDALFKIVEELGAECVDVPVNIGCIGGYSGEQKTVDELETASVDAGNFNRSIRVSLDLEAKDVLSEQEGNLLPIQGELTGDPATWPVQVIQLSEPLRQLSEVRSRLLWLRSKLLANPKIAKQLATIFTGEDFQKLTTN